MAGNIVYARARPERVRLIETYFYEGEISANPWILPGRPPTGRIEVTVPYDGDQFFTHQACQDVAKQQGTDPQGRAEALIGHLALAEYDRTNLGDLLALPDRYGSVPLRVPVAGNGLAGPEDLRSDRQAAAITFDYARRREEGRDDVRPIDVTMDLLDEEALGTPGEQLSPEERATQMADVATQISRHANFFRCLRLDCGVRLSLPESWPEELQPTVKRVSLGWPTITSFRGLHLTVDGAATTVTYNPAARCLEWSDVPMRAVGTPEGTGLRDYRSGPMRLLIDQPGELYLQGSLEGRVEVEIPGKLLSGLEARLYDGTGAPQRALVPELTTRLIVSLRLILDDAFRRRLRSPLQHLHFQEIIPDELRVADIKAALVDRGFRIPPEHDVALECGQKELRHLMLGQRPEGPDTMNLWVLVEGRQHSTQRRSQVPGGQTYTTTFESGELRVDVRGVMRGDSGRLVQEMNALQRALRERFERLRAKR